MMLPLACLCLALALTSVTVVETHDHPALAKTRASDSDSSEETLEMVVSPVSRSAETSSDLGLGSQYVLEELRKTKDLVSRLQTGLRRTQDQVTKTQEQVTKTQDQVTKTHDLVTRTQDQVTRTQDQVTRTQDQVTRTQDQVTKTQDQMTSTHDLVTRTQDLVTRLQAGQGSTYIRWGRNSCPNNTNLVYTGIAGGKQHNHKGDGSNRLCLTNTPQFDNTPNPSHTAYLYGSEYQIIGNHHDHDVPCSVCLTPQSATIMVPATLTCPPGWTPQYSGHLAAEYYDHYSSEYVCLDGDLEDYSGGLRDDNGLLFYLVLTRCGSLPCPPYIGNRVVTCVVCSK